MADTKQNAPKAPEPQIPAAARMAMESAAKEKANKAAEKFFPKNPDPESPVPAKKLAKGGVTRADGCCSKGHTKGRMV